MYTFTRKSFHENCQVFLSQQLTLFRDKFTPDELKIGHEFLEFLLQMISKTSPDTWGGTSPKIMFDYLQDKKLEPIWNSQSTFWAQIETPITYFTFGALIHTWLQGKKSDRILSIGAGPGLYELFWENQLQSIHQRTIITCTDFADNMVTEGLNNKKRYSDIYNRESRVLFKKGSATNFHSKDASMDIVISNNVLNWLTDWKGSISEMHRVLKKGGWAIISTRPAEPAMVIPGGQINLAPKIEMTELTHFIKNLFGDVEKVHLFEVPAGLGQGGANFDLRLSLLIQKK